MTDAKIKWDDYVAKCAAAGVLAKRLYVVLTRPANGLDAVREQLQAHLAYQGEIEGKGVMFAAGPFADDDEAWWEGEGMVIIRAGSLAEAKSIAAADPMHASGARTFRVRPWLMNEGSMTVTITCSTGKQELV